jgi:molecular chaperone HtpG
MPKINTARSIRLRKGNIQIGLENTMDKLFKDTRWSKYYFGEVYTVSPDLIPNARRDYFLETHDLKEFEKYLAIKFNELQKLNYFSSNIRSEKRKIDEFVAFSVEFEEKTNKGGFTNNEEKKKYQEKFDSKKEKAILAEKELEKFKELNNNPSQNKIFEKVIGEPEQKVEKVTVIENNGRTKYLTDDISRLNKKDRKLVSKILSIIDSALTKDLAENLKHKIVEELNK